MGDVTQTHSGGAGIPDRSTAPGRALAGLLGLPGVDAGADLVRDACAQLRFHEALRRRIPEAATESRVRGAAASAELEGASYPLEAVRDHMRGALPWSDRPDPVEAAVRAAVMVTAETEHVAKILRSAPLQALARLHVAAMSGQLEPDRLGRPRQAGEVCEEFVTVGEPLPADQVPARLALLADLIRDPSAPAPVVAALVHAEIATVRPFVRGNGLVARALERAYWYASGLDVTGVAVPERGYAQAGATYVGALMAYVQGTAQGVGVWLQSSLRAQSGGVMEGRAIADAVLRGRLS